ncbi:T-cell receptor alpha chain [Roseibium sp. TrichSKD4]|nr:T-cell receptor alpha chain [Roseibium sp. TrichSKD4]
MRWSGKIAFGPECFRLSADEITREGYSVLSKNAPVTVGTGAFLCCANESDD